MAQKSYKLLQDRFDYQKGTIVYPFNGYDYGLANDDTHVFGEQHISVTANKDGSLPCFTAPISILEEQ